MVSRMVFAVCEKMLCLDEKHLSAAKAALTLKQFTARVNSCPDSKPEIYRTLSRLLHNGAALALVVFFAASVLPLGAQKRGQRGSEPLQTLTPPELRDEKAPNYGPRPPRTPTFEDMQYRRYVESRLKSMVEDANKLFRLAKDLNKDADALHNGSSTQEDLRMVSEIAKLAHNVKWKMQLVVHVNRGE